MLSQSWHWRTKQVRLRTAVQHPVFGMRSHTRARMSTRGFCSALGRCNIMQTVCAGHCSLLMVLPQRNSTIVLFKLFWYMLLQSPKQLSAAEYVSAAGGTLALTCCLQMQSVLLPVLCLLCSPKSEWTQLRMCHLLGTPHLHLTLLLTDAVCAATAVVCMLCSPPSEWTQLRMCHLSEDPSPSCVGKGPENVAYGQQLQSLTQDLPLTGVAAGLYAAR